MKTMYYKHSGRIGLPSLKQLCINIPVIVLLAGLYALITRYNPFIYFSVIATLLFGLVIGYIGNLFAEASHSRSAAFDLASEVVFGIFALWASWLIWVALSFEDGTTQMMQLLHATPAEWYSFLDWLAHHRYETVSRYYGAGSKSAPATPTEFALQWGIEAILIVGISMLACGASSHDRFYSEKMKRWAVQRLKTEVNGIAVDEPDQLRSAFEQGDFSALNSAVPYSAPTNKTGNEESKCFEITLFDDPDDSQLRVINVNAIEHYVNAKGKSKKREKTVVKKMLMPEPVYDALVARLGASGNGTR